MRGLLADSNVQGHMVHIQQLLEQLDLWPVFIELKIVFATFADLGLPLDLDDRTLWQRCQEGGWVLFTENRNHEDADSLEATLRDSWQPGHLPVLTLASKHKFQSQAEYARKVARDVANQLFDLQMGKINQQPRIYVPL